jgi:PHD/YefM family antitoxin component YafN of YafNO toxin-antitoxin module
MVITQNGQPKAVLLDCASYEDLREATLLLKLLAQSEADVRAGRTAAQKTVFSAARSRLSSR